MQNVWGSDEDKNDIDDSNTSTHSWSSDQWTGESYSSGDIGESSNGWDLKEQYLFQDMDR